MTTRMVADRADKVLVCFEESAKYYKHPEKVQVVGMPVRREFIDTDPQTAKKELGLDSRPVVVSAFGSQGAREMNKAVAQMFTLEAAAGLPFQHIHAVGSFGWEWMPDHVRELGVELENCPGIDMREYIYNMPTVMAAADVIISRGGASTLNEIAVSGTPAIIIPSPNVTDNHQEKNARVLENRDGAVVILEKDCSGKVLYDQVNALLQDPVRRQTMSLNLKNMAVSDSAQQICDMIQQLASKK
jgi:UDP-N-acetylglucosamine--N-acetylmuramyl-(pentapeptide) pyrophosphoryl-undecaprenol N-acetylglucosamine transferase